MIFGAWAKFQPNFVLRSVVDFFVFVSKSISSGSMSNFQQVGGMPNIVRTTAAHRFVGFPGRCSWTRCKNAYIQTSFGWVAIRWTKCYTSHLIMNDSLTVLLSEYILTAGYFWLPLNPECNGRGSLHKERGLPETTTLKIVVVYYLVRSQ